MIKNFLIIGCGLIGSSILQSSLKNKVAKKIFVFEKSKKNILKIKKLRLPITIVNNLNSVVSKMDFIIFCTPMSEYEKIILKITRNINTKVLITDVGSTKEFFLSKIRKKIKKDANWVSSHPIAGSEVSGPEHGSANLFLDKWSILIKEKNTKKRNLKFLTNFWKKLGSKVLIMDAKKHDAIFSMTSHLPHLIAYNLINTASEFEKKKKYNLIQYSAGGLRDFSRIAASNEIMWRDIFFNNKRNIVSAINLFINNLNSFKKNIENLDDRTLRKKLINSKKVRQQILSLKQDIAKPDFGRDQD